MPPAFPQPYYCSVNVLFCPSSPANCWQLRTSSLDPIWSNPCCVSDVNLKQKFHFLPQPRLLSPLFAWWESNFVWSQHWGFQRINMNLDHRTILGAFKRTQPSVKICSHHSMAQKCLLLTVFLLPIKNKFRSISSCGKKSCFGEFGNHMDHIRSIWPTKCFF